MKILWHLVTGLFGLALGLAIVSWVVDAGLQPAPILAKVPSGIYSQVASALPTTFGRVAAASTDQQALLRQFIDAGLVRQLANNLVTGEVSYLHGHGPAPMLDLDDLANRANLAGAELSPQVVSLLGHPQPFGDTAPSRGARSVVTWVDRLRWLAPLATVVLGVLIWILGGHRRFAHLARGMIVALVVLGAAVLFGLALPSLIGSALKASPLAPLGPPLRAVAVAETKALNLELLRAMLGLAAAAILLFACQLLFGRKHKHA